MEKKITALIKKLPDSPGVYKFKDEEGRVLYVGKAKSLKKRVQSYFRAQKGRAVRTQKLIDSIRDLEWTETSSDLEAIVLESNLIKELKPKYNVLMKDGKNFVYIKVTKNEDFPRVKIVRQVEKDGARYFGPKTSAKRVKDTLVLLQKLFKYRSCDLGICWRAKDKVEITKKTIAYPCLDFHIKRCDAPCIAGVTPQEYGSAIAQVELFLEGKTEDLEKDLKAQMESCVATKEFEKAALLRDKIIAVANLSEKQLVSSPDYVNMDVFGFVIDGDRVFFTQFIFRGGKLIGQENFVADSGGFSAGEEDEASELLESFLFQLYERVADVPEQILVPSDFEDRDFFEAWMKSKVVVPQKGKKHKIIELAAKNAESFMKQYRARFERAGHDEKEALAALTEELGLKKEPKRIESYDISHLSGTDTVASMVVFENAAPKKSDYRKFRLKSLEEGEIDDYKAMKEVLRRRFSRLRQDVQIRQAAKSKKKDIEGFLKEGWGQDEMFGDVSEYYIAYFDKKPVGMVRMIPGDKDLYLLEVLYVVPKMRECGIAKALMRHAIAKTKAKRVYLFCDSTKVDYYKGFGFKEVKTMPDEFLGRVRNFEHVNPGVAAFLFAYDPGKEKDASFEAKPDLILIDGGKGQLGVGLDLAEEYGIDIPMIGLAKREEEIFVKGQKFPLPIQRDSKALYLLQRVRDEAHRFAIGFQKDSRKKHLQKSSLDEVPGLSQRGKMLLLREFGSVEKIREVGVEGLSQVVTKKLAEKIMGYLG